jgi:hypothetical protein
VTRAEVTWHAGLVRQWCADNKVTYRHFATLGDNIASTYKYLDRLGQPDKMHTG